MESNMIARAMLKNWPLIVICAMIATAAALAASLMAAPTYESRARFIVSPDPAVLSNQNDYLYSLNVLDDRSLPATFVEVITSRRTFDQVVGTVPMPTAELAQYEVSAAIMPETNVVEMIVTGPQPRRVSLVGTVIGQSAIDYMGSMYQGFAFNFLDQPTVPTEQSFPQPMQAAIVALILGTALGAGLAVLKDFLSHAPMRRYPRGETNNHVVLPWAQFERRLQDSISYGYPPFSLGLVHISDYQNNKDFASYQILDHVMEQSVQIANHSLREGDLIGLVNKSTFAVLIYGAKGQSAHTAMNRVKLMLSHYLASDKQAGQFPLQTKVGLVEYIPGNTIHQLIKRAKQSLDSGKSNGSDTAPTLVRQPNPTSDSKRI